MNKVVHVGLLGFGTVGGGVVQIFQNNAAIETIEITTKETIHLFSIFIVFNFYPCEISKYSDKYIKYLK